MTLRIDRMSFEIAEEQTLRQCVQRLLDADLILAGDSEALLGCVTERTPALQLERERLIRLLETLVSDGGLTAATVIPVLAAVRGEIGTAG
jgi:hypothetical protein